MAEHKADVAEMLGVVDELTVITNAIEGALEDAEQASKRLHERWQGEGAEAHLTSHLAWAGEVSEMRDALGKMRAALRTAAGNYDAAVQANLRSWQ